MFDNELTMTEALHDPMIRLLLRADRISLGEFAKVMEKAARSKDLPFPAYVPRQQTPCSPAT